MSLRRRPSSNPVPAGPRWQLLPELSADEYRALRADIAANGVRVPVVIDADTGAVIDGHHRLRAIEELAAGGVKVDYLRQPMAFVDDEERVGFVLATNLFRRHLSRAQRSELVGRLRERGWSLRRIAGALGVDDKTVRNDLGEIAEKSAISEPERIERKGGGTYPARRPKPPPSVIVRSSRDEARARAALAVLGTEAPSGLVELRRAEELARKANLARRRAAELPVAMTGAAWELHCGDFAEVLSDLPDGSVDAIVTDPPYNTDGLPLYSALSAFAARVLRPGALLVAYAGTADLPQAIARLGEHLDYVWTGAVVLPGRTPAFRARMVRGSWRPVLLYSAGPYQPRGWLIDTFSANGRGDKSPTDHHWQQALGPFIRLVELVTRPGELVVDPFAGSGTTGVACLAAGRRFLGSDIDAGAVSMATERLRAAESQARPCERPDAGAQEGGGTA